MPWILKGLLILVKTRKGRELLFTGALIAAELAQGKEARKVYAKAAQAIRPLRDLVMDAARPLRGR
jgi:hypothetical protein